MACKEDKLWLLNERRQFETTEENRPGFAGKYPPKKKEVLMKFFAYHAYLQDQSNKTSSTREAAFLVASDLEKWWCRTGYSKSIEAHVYCVEKVSNYTHILTLFRSGYLA